MCVCIYIYIYIYIHTYIHTYVHEMIKKEKERERVTQEAANEDHARAHAEEARSYLTECIHSLVFQSQLLTESQHPLSTREMPHNPHS